MSYERGILMFTGESWRSTRTTRNGQNCRRPCFHCSDCLWNDVLHCSPIHPRRLYDAWRATGVERVPRKVFFQIPIDRLEDHPVAVMRGRELAWLDTARFQEITAVPVETVEWYRKLARQGRFGAHFVGVPHILVKDPIDIEGVEIVNWRDPIGPPAIP